MIEVENEGSGRSRFAGLCAVTYGLGWLVGGYLLFSGNVLIYDDLVGLSGKEASSVDPASLHLAQGWWRMVIGDLVIMVANTGLILAIAGLAWFHGRRDVRVLGAALVIIVWTTIAMVVDTFLAGTAWLLGPQTGMGVDPETVATVFNQYHQHVNNVLRYPARGMYLFVGAALIFLSFVAKSRGWSGGVRWACLFLGIAMWIEVLTFVITVSRGSSPIQFPAYYLMYYLAAPVFGIVMGNALRRGMPKVT